MTVTVEITEVLQRQVTVDVPDGLPKEVAEQCGLAKVEEMYDKCSIVLDANDLIEKETKVISCCK